MPRPSVLLAHLSDIHLPLTAAFPPHLWTTKRLLGWLNWQRKRRFVHTRAALDAIVADIKAHTPDHILLSGDLINIGLPGEYAAAASWLATLGPPTSVALVPGNHDAYITREALPGLALWQPYSLGEPPASRGSPDYPYVRHLGAVAIVGVNSGVPTPIGIAQGEIGTDQLARLSHILKDLGERGLVRLVMLHHPPFPDATPNARALRDARALQDLIAAAGAELIVHGHNHIMSSKPVGSTRVEGVASASAARKLGHEPRARYNLIGMTPSADTIEIDIETRGIDAAGGVVSIERRSYATRRIGSPTKAAP